MVDNRNTIQDSWAKIQERYADMPGQKGIEERKKAYAQYFMRYGEGVSIDEGCRISHPWNIVLDDDARINIRTIIYGSGGVWIGRHVQIGPCTFIHSANHECSPSPKAYFERGYIYSRTVIGDNCLVSANVSILPGAVLGTGCFVSCGAVITRGEYSDGSRLFGVPAKPKPHTVRNCDFEDSPEIAIVVPEEGRWKESAYFLLTVLGLPQVRVFNMGELLPESVHTILTFGMEYNLLNTDKRTWRLANGDLVLHGEMKFYPPNEDVIEVPALLKDTWAYDGYGDRKTVSNALKSILFILEEKLRKQTVPLEDIEVAEICIFTYFLKEAGYSYDTPPFSRIFELIIGKGCSPESSMSKESLEELLRSKDANMLFPRAEHLVLSSADEETCRAMRDFWRSQKFLTAKYHLRFPVMTVISTMRYSQGDRIEIEPLFKVLHNHITNSNRAASLALSFALIGANEKESEIINMLLKPPWNFGSSTCIRSYPDASSFSMSFLVAALLLRHARFENKTIEYFEEHRSELHWHVLNNDNGWIADNGNDRGVLVDPNDRLISISILDNWLASQSVPDSNGIRYVFNEVDSEFPQTCLEEIWLSIFRYMQMEAKRSLIRLKPWPFGKDIALSIRYDMDRRIHSRRAQELLDIQRQFINSAAGSWYIFASDFDKESPLLLLDRTHQEIGLHTVAPVETEMNGRSVTAHSSPASCYWRGRESIDGHEKAGALYTENFCVQVPWARAAWIDSTGTEGRTSTIWAVPKHFPIEGTTRDKDLSYFNTQSERFQSYLDLGGHIILASHPDLNKELLIEVLKRESFDEVWAVPVSMAVERCRRIMEYGSISTTQVGNKDIALISKFGIADLQVEIHDPDLSFRKSCLQLAPGIPRPLSE